MIQGYIRFDRGFVCLGTGHLKLDMGYIKLCRALHPRP